MSEKGVYKRGGVHTWGSTSRSRPVNECNLLSVHSKREGITTLEMFREKV